MSASLVIIGLLAIGLIWFGRMLSIDADKKMATDNSNGSTSFLIGILTNFFDTLGIGSFAPATALLKVTKSIDERVLPGTLNVSMCIPVMLQAIIFIKKVEVDITTLVVLIGCSVIGSYFGAGIVSGLPKKKIKLIMGIALIAIAGFFVLSLTGVTGSLAGTAKGLDPVKLAIGGAIFVVLGALMSAGVGLYAPAMVTVSLLGMDPIIAFPVMMGACAFLMPVGSAKFIKESAYAPKISVFIALGGVVGVVFATNLVLDMPMDVLKWLVVGVCIITGAVMIKESTEIKE